MKLFSSLCVCAVYVCASRSRQRCWALHYHLSTSLCFSHCESAVSECVCIHIVWVHECHFSTCFHFCFQISPEQMTLDQLTSTIFNPPLSLHSVWHSGPFCFDWPLFDTHTRRGYMTTRWHSQTDRHNRRPSTFLSPGGIKDAARSMA